jgi:hypothetical protein
MWFEEILKHIQLPVESLLRNVGTKAQSSDLSIFRAFLLGKGEVYIYFIKKLTKPCVTVTRDS